MDRCVICGKEFLRVGVQKTCSPECSEEMTKRYMKDWHDRQYGNRIRECLVCGKKFESRYGRMLCSDECREEWEKIRDHNWHKKTYKPKIRICVICGKEFTGWGKAKTCSEECRIAYRKQRRKKEWENYSKSRYGEVITRYLINKLKELKDEFTYKGEKYIVEDSTESRKSWVSQDSDKKLEIGFESVNGRIKVTSVTFWEDGTVIEKLEY